MSKKRQVIHPDWLPAHTLNYLRITEFTRPGNSYSDIVFGRSNGTDLAVKALAIVIPEQVAHLFTSNMSLDDIMHELLNHLTQTFVIVIHQYRPITYLPWSDDGKDTEVKYNVQVELPGGIIEAGELKGFAAKRELLEEAGLWNHRILCVTDLYFGFLANSAGHQQERYGMSLIIATGEIGSVTAEQNEEGIVRAELIPFNHVHRHLDTLAENGYLIEWAAYLGTDRLARLLFEHHLSSLS
ncbi:MAG: NUDIX domain-containing protein [Patescibacteria group bacterium]